jgi:hypothetical protein
MMRVDYNIDQAGDNFKVVGDYEGEVMGKQKDGTDKSYHLYRPGDAIYETYWCDPAEFLLYELRR